MNTLRVFTKDELFAILQKHAEWLEDSEKGERANLSYADLRYADLIKADLHYANLSYANLRYANLRYANLSYANLRYANLSYADLRYANLSYADLSYANLILVGQDIRGYLFYAFINDNEVIVLRAGCREFVGISAARNHWAERHTEDAILHEDCLSLVDRCERMAKARGWKLEPTAED